MKYVITGSLGHISRAIVTKLISSGHEVTVISSKSDKKSEIEAMGAKAAIGSVEDSAFLSKTFTGADAVYTMVPPTFAAADWKAHIASIGKNYADAIRTAGVKNVVNLSSIGAHMPTGCGPVSGLYQVESELNKLEGVNVKHLRPGFFYYNFLNSAGMAKHMGIIGGNYGENAQLYISDTNDIADAAVEELTKLNFSGKSVRYQISDSKTTSEIASVFGKAIGKPELPWVNFKDEDSFNGMVQAGLPAEVAKNYVEMGTAMRSGAMIEDLLKNGTGVSGKVKLEDFAGTFVSAYQAS